MEKLNEKIKYYRERIPMSKSDLSRKVGVSPSYITMLENGEKTNPSLEIQIKIAEALNIPVVTLMGNSELNEYLNNNNNNNKEMINIVNTNKDLCYELKISPTEVADILDLNSNITIESLQSLCKYLNLEHEEEAFLYSIYIHRTTNDLFRIVAFYSYLKHEWGSDLSKPSEAYFEAGENLNAKFHLSLNLGYALGRSNSRAIGEIIANKNKESYTKIFRKIYELDNTYSFQIDNLTIEEEHELFAKLADTLRHELYLISKKRKEIKADFYD